ncbi:hypothetical protein vBSlqSZDD2_21 [Serratia phage vB_SlqS_ZDD2]|nr:hypothetical protein vBSlqSZDD2_21 [Serratia phage vB_SlqS_ZDD2]
MGNYNFVSHRVHGQTDADIERALSVVNERRTANGLPKLAKMNFLAIVVEEWIKSRLNAKTRANSIFIERHKGYKPRRMLDQKAQIEDAEDE